MWLLAKLGVAMGCGQSKSGSKALSNGGDCDTDIYRKASTEEKKTNSNPVTVSAVEKKPVTPPCSSSPSSDCSVKSAGGNQRNKTGASQQANGEVKTAAEDMITDCQDELVNVSPAKKSAAKEGAVMSATLQTSQTHVTGSQLEFFRMLDEKIEQGQDYHWEDDT